MLSKTEVLRKIEQIINQRARQELLDVVLTYLLEKHNRILSNSNVQILRQEWNPFWVADINSVILKHDALCITIKNDKQLFNMAYDLIKNSLIECLTKDQELASAIWPEIIKDNLA